MNKLLSYLIDCPALSNNVNIYAPVRSLRQRNILALREMNTVIKFKSVIYRANKSINSVNECANNENVYFDIFNLSISSFKRVVKKLILKYNL